MDRCAEEQLLEKPFVNLVARQFGDIHMPNVCMILDGLGRDDIYSLFTDMNMVLFVIVRLVVLW